MITIAIDGFSACGKSTLAKAMARQLDYRFIDTGAMYRAVTLYFLRHQTELDNEKDVAVALDHITIDFRQVNGKNHVFLNGEDVESEIRGLAVSQFVSPVATVSAVRRAMVAQQRRMGQEGGVVMDGRDIGTVVFPDAELKLFVTASLPVRVQRRYEELVAKGKTVNKAEIEANLLERDHIDSTRADSPLSQAADAIVIDNSDLSLEAFIERGMALARTRI